MSSYYPYKPEWGYHRQDSDVSGSYNGYHNNENDKMGGHTQNGMINNGNRYVSPSHSKHHNHINENAHDYPSFSFSDNFYNGTGSDTRYLVQMMSNLNQQLDRLTQLIAQNNQLLQSMHDQEDTKCVQGAGGGAVIVRM